MIEQEIIHDITPYIDVFEIITDQEGNDHLYLKDKSVTSSEWCVLFPGKEWISLQTVEKTPCGKMPMMVIHLGLEMKSGELQSNAPNLFTDESLVNLFENEFFVTTIKDSATYYYNRTEIMRKDTIKRILE